MIEKTLLEDGTGVVLTFAIPATRATGDVSVAGDFNDWQPSATPLRRVGDQLVGSVMVRSGQRYAFRYFCNGDWFNDETANSQRAQRIRGLQLRRRRRVTSTPMTQPHFGAPR